MSTNKNTKPNPKNTEDVFKGLKFVDSMLNEAAKVQIPESMKNDFESQLKAKLLEGEFKAAPEETVEENRFTDKQNYNYPNYNYEAKTEEPGAETPGATDAGATPGAEAGVGSTDPGAEPGMEPGADATPGMDDAGAAGAMGGGAGAPPDAGAEPGMDAGAGAADIDTLDSPEDIEALVDQLIDKDIEENMGAEQESLSMTEPNQNPTMTMESKIEENKVEETTAVTEAKVEEATNVEETTAPVTESTMEENEEEEATQTIEEVLAEIEESVAVGKGDEHTKADVETLTSKVTDAGKKIDQAGNAQGNPEKAEVGGKHEKLGADTLTSTVSDKGKKEATTTEPTSKVSDAGKKVDQTKAQGNPEKANVGAKYEKPEVATLTDKMKKESVLKSKALFVLAEKYLALEDTHKALKFEHYKSLKANGILALAPDLSEETRISLVKKFDECKTYKAAKALYEDVVGMIKTNKKTSISEATGKDNTIKVVKEVKENLNEGAEISDAEKRIRFLSGEKGYGDQYFNCP